MFAKSFGRFLVLVEIVYSKQQEVCLLRGNAKNFRFSNLSTVGKKTQGTGDYRIDKVFMNVFTIFRKQES